MIARYGRRVCAYEQAYLVLRLRDALLRARNGFCGNLNQLFGLARVEQRCQTPALPRLDKPQ